MSLNCLLCGNQHSTLFDQRNFRGQLVTNRICTNCGLVFQSPRMSESELASYYEREYRMEYHGSEGPNPKDLAAQTGRAESLVQFTEGSVGAISRHLDIGSSAGLILQKIQEVYQCQPVGIEPGTAYRKYAQAHGLTVYPSLEELENAGQQRFDLISMAHVLEHLPDPVGYLAHLRFALLEKDGHLLIEVPNLYAHECFETAHLLSFSPHTLTQTLQKAGFVVDMLEAHGRPRSIVIPLYLTLLAHSVIDSEQPISIVKPEYRVKWKRKMGMLRRKVLTRLIPPKAWVQPGKTE